MSKLIIGQPYIEERGEFAYLCSDIFLPNEEKKTIWYRIDKKFSKYFVIENADAFLANCIYYALWFGVDVFVDAPVSMELLYQLKNYYVPVMSKTKSFFHPIDISAKSFAKRHESLGYASTGISCGVDSYYSMLKHIDFPLNDYNVKCVLFQDWFSIGLDAEYQKTWKDVFQERTEKVSNELNLVYIYVSCNIDEILSTPDLYDEYYGFICSKGFYTYKYCSTALALGKMINKYYFSSGYDDTHFDLNPKGKVFDEDHYSLFNISVLSTNNVHFYHFGGDVTRIEKLEYLSKHEIVKNTLSVCSNDENCGMCQKCIRTQGELYAINKLDEFDNCFKNQYFKKHKIKCFCFILTNTSNDFFAEIVEKCKENNVHIPIASYVYLPMYIVEQWGRKHFKDVKIARFIYDRLVKRK